MAAVFDSNNFQSDVLEADKLVLVDFWAEWCGPCRQLGPVIDQLADENGDVAIGKMDVDANQELAMQFGITNIPAILLFKDGEVVERMIGAQPKAKLQEAIDQHRASA